MLLQSAYAIIDLAWVSKLGEAAVAGLSISLQAFFIVLAVSQAIATTALADISQAYGAGRIAEARAAFSAYAVLGVGVGTAAAIAAYVTADLYVAIFTADPEVQRLGLEYFEITALTFLLQLLLIVFGNGLRGTGDFTTPTKLMFTSVVINIVLDPVLIFGWGPFEAHGLAGAAWATVIAQTIAVLVYVALLGRPGGRGTGLSWRRPGFSMSLVSKIVTRGLPAGVQFFMLSAVVGIVLGAMREHGASWTAAAGGGFRVMQQCFLPMVALGSAAAAVAGQNLGAQNPRRVARAAWTALRWAMGYGVIVATLLVLGGRVAGRIFAETEAELDVAAVYFLWAGPSVAVFGATYVPTFVLQAAGKAARPMVAAILRVALLATLVFGAIPALGLGPQWVFGAWTVTAALEAGADTALLGVFLRGMRGA